MTGRLLPSERVLYAGTCQTIALAERFPAARRAGFTAVTLFTSDLVQARAQGIARADLRAMIEAEGLTLQTMEIVGNWYPGQRRDTATLPAEMAEMLMLSTPEAVCGAAVEMGAATVTIADLFGTSFDGPLVAQSLGRVCDVAAGHGLSVILEPVPLGCVGTVAQAREALERADRANLGIILDSWHVFRGGSSLADVAALPREFIAAWQMNDASAAPALDDVFSDMLVRTWPGEGDFDIGGLMRAIGQTGTGAPAGIELIADGFEAMTPDDIATRAAQALDYCIELSGESL